MTNLQDQLTVLEGKLDALFAVSPNGSLFISELQARAASMRKRLILAEAQRGVLGVSTQLCDLDGPNWNRMIVNGFSFNLCLQEPRLQVQLQVNCLLLQSNSVSSQIIHVSILISILLLQLSSFVMHKIIYV